MLGPDTIYAKPPSLGSKPTAISTNFVRVSFFVFAAIALILATANAMAISDKMTLGNIEALVGGYIPVRVD